MFSTCLKRRCYPETAGATAGNLEGSHGNAGLFSRKGGLRGNNAYSFLEILVALACIGFFCAVIGSRLAGTTNEATIIVALQQMDQIKQAIRDHFYPDLGVIPQDTGKDGAFASDDCPDCGKDDRPWFATRFLCLRNDGEEKPEYEDMLAFLTSLMSEDLALGKLAWDSYYKKGWRGPYLEYSSRVQLDTDTSSYAFPLIATPWAEVSEELAQAAETSNNTQLAERLRRGKYYFIVVDRDSDNNYALLTDTARIVCFGSDGKDSGAYYKDYDADDPTTLATADDLRKMPTCDSASSTDCYETGDDIVMFIFGGGATRRPETTN
jgi:type II secretory pathway pseudopilin PulG